VEAPHVFPQLRFVIRTILKVVFHAYFNHNIKIKVETLYQKETLYFSSIRADGGVCFDTLSSYLIVMFRND